MAFGCPVQASTSLQSFPAGSICLRLETANGIGTWVKLFFQYPTSILVRPVMPACTALCPMLKQKAESGALAGMLRMV